jgi:hypothetical protein
MHNLEAFIMSISTELTRLAQNVGALTADTTAIFEALRAKGVSVPADAKLADCPELISLISGGGVELGILNNFKFSASGMDASGPFTINNGIFSINRSFQFSSLSTFDISNAINIKIKLRLKIDRAFYTQYFLANWYGLGNRFIRFGLNVTDSSIQVFDVYTADNASSASGRGSLNTIYDTNIFNDFHDIIFEFDIINSMFKFYFDDKSSTMSCVFPYRGIWAPGFGCSWSSLNQNGIMVGAFFDINNFCLKINDSVVWGME